LWWCIAGWLYSLGADGQGSAGRVGSNQASIKAVLENNAKKLEI
jgi:hypothetical protein